MEQLQYWGTGEQSQVEIESHWTWTKRERTDGPPPLRSLVHDCFIITSEVKPSCYRSTPPWYQVQRKLYHTGPLKVWRTSNPKPSSVAADADSSSKD